MGADRIAPQRRFHGNCCNRHVGYRRHTGITGAALPGCTRRGRGLSADEAQTVDPAEVDIAFLSAADLESYADLGESLDNVIVLHDADEEIARIANMFLIGEALGARVRAARRAAKIFLIFRFSSTYIPNSTQLKISLSTNTKANFAALIL